MLERATLLLFWPILYMLAVFGPYGDVRLGPPPQPETYKASTNTNQPQLQEAVEASFLARATEPMAIYTLVLTIATIWLGLSTKRLWRTTADLTRHNQTTERAYIVGGGPCKGMANARYVFSTDIDNHGKTPADIHWIFVSGILGRPQGFAFDHAPAYAGGHHVGLWVRGQSQCRRVEWQRAFTHNEVPRPFIYGRIWYSDVFGQRHSCGFIYEIVNVNLAEETAETRPVHGAPARYTQPDWDKDREFEERPPA